ncbi:MAG: tetraacyldisaccharide 4'-kinase [Deltaproteobacteria bacterium GWC2_42_11]|nr:MAG: tetraacyldisaccharide 4'-kinase [Deltaproteobacteria bacterium GWC2_42_11]HBO85030.1 tetraacyldisaccharide 4'-kinase [Deltaproteobacteria bacterium]
MSEYFKNVILFPLYLISILYYIGIRLRSFLYHSNILKTNKLPCMVISIGNITVGGSGKTPMTIYLCRVLTAMDKKVVVLSRGYKGKSKGINVVSDGCNIFMTADEAGDEPFLIASSLNGVPVIISRDRYSAGLFAIEKYKPDVILLDDGFQHIRLKRDIDIVLVDSIRGFGNGYLLPMGILREPVGSIKRAHIIFIKGNDMEIVNKIRENGINAPVGFFEYIPHKLVNITDGTSIEPHRLKNKNIVAFAGIANPVSFSKTLEQLGALIKHYIVFSDHYQYLSRDIDRIMKSATDADYVITTEKDAVKIKNILAENMAVYKLEIEVKVHNEQEFLRWII